MKKNLRIITGTLVIGVALITSSAYAQITITESQGNPLTSWLLAPQVTTASTPSAATFGTAENNYGSGTAQLGQTFEATTSGVLDDIQMDVSGPDSVYNIYLYDLGAASGYSALSGGSLPSSLQGFLPTSGENVLPSGTTFEYYGSASQGLMSLAFTYGSSADDVSLNAGDLYYLRITPQSTGAELSWYRTAADTYLNGCAYRGGSPGSTTAALSNGGYARDFSLAVEVTPVPEPSTMALMALAGGAALLGWRQKRRSV